MRETEAGWHVKTTDLASALATHQDQRSEDRAGPAARHWAGRLALHDELTSAEVSAGFRIAEIYQGFEFFHGRTRSAAGSSFFRQFVADLEKPIEVTRRRTDDYIDIDREEREREARENFDVLQYYMPVPQRDLIELVCVESRPINPVSIPILKMVLQYFFEIFRDDKLPIEAQQEIRRRHAKGQIL
jgi:hypothetical protein